MNVMQKGIATLEIVMVIFIVGVLASCAVPNAVRVLDRVSLDYETKNLYTELRFLQSHERMTFMTDSHFQDKGNLQEENFQNNLDVSPEKYVITKNSTDKIYAEHYFSGGVTASKIKSIKFDDMGRISPATSDTLTIKSRLGKELYFAFDSVGRFRGSRTKPK